MISEGFVTKFLTMNKIPLEKLIETLSRNKKLSFAYLFGSAADGDIKPNADVDIAAYFSKDPGPDDIYELTTALETVLEEGLLDLVILNGCDDFVLRNEVLKGTLLVCADPDQHAAFFSWTLRMYEDQMIRMERAKLSRKDLP